MMLEPHLALLADNRAQNITDFAPASAVLLLTLISTGVSLALGIAVGVIAFSLKLPSWGASAPAAAEPGSPTVTSSPVVVSSGDRGQPFEPRAAAMVAAVAAMDRREVAVQQTTTNQASSRLRVDTSNAPVGASVVTPFGQTYRRAARPGRAASTQRRDQ
jgi:hypothetical protein